jgi:hypothetical protein
VLCSMYVRHDKTALDIRIAPGSNSVPVPIADTRHSSVPKCEERSLGEMSITCGQLAAAVPAVQTSSSPRNCMSAIITMP